MPKKVSKIKVGLCALLGYGVLNIIRTILFSIVCVITSGFNGKFIRYRLEEFGFFFSFIIGYMACNFIGEKILKTEDALRRYAGTIGILFIFNYAYFLVDYFRYGEGKLFEIIIPLLAGIYLFFKNRKKENITEDVTEE